MKPPGLKRDIGSAPNNASTAETAFAQPGWYLKRTRFNIRIRAETVAEFLNNSRPGDILDIGCGDGSLSLPLLDGRNQITLLDQSESMLRIARSRVPPQFVSQVRTINSGFMDAELENSTFDLILCVGVLAYVESRLRPNFIYKLASFLKPGGSLILECTDGHHVASYFVRTYMALLGFFRKARVRTVVGSSAEVIAICETLGLQLRQSFRYTLPLPLMKRFLDQQSSYRFIRLLFGSATNNRVPILGNECIYYFSRLER